MIKEEGPVPKWESKLEEYQSPPKDPRTGFQLRRLKEREQLRQHKVKWRKRRERLLRWKDRAELATARGDHAVRLYVPHEEHSLQQHGRLLKKCQKSQQREIPAEYLLEWIDQQYTKPSA